MELTNYIEDDWDDNALTSRSNPEKGVFYQYGDGGTGDLLKGVYRPQWNITHGSPVSTNQQLELNAGNSTQQGVRTTSNIVTGFWELDWSAVSGMSNGGWEISVICGQQIDAAGRGHNSYFLQFFNSGGQDFRKNVDGSNTNIISNSWSVDTSNYTTKLTRDSYSNFELFLNGSSQGTGNDNTFTESKALATGNYSNTEIHYDNLVVR